MPVQVAGEEFALEDKRRGMIVTKLYFLLF
jgi:hypothetical protein